MAKKSNDERIFPLYAYPTLFFFFAIWFLVGGEVFFRFAEPLDKFPAILEADQTLSYKLKDKATGQFVSGDGEVDVAMSVNARGLRDGVILHQKPWNTTRILALGGASTFGWGLPLEETFPKLLEKQLSNQSDEKRQNFEVINGGVPGYTLSQSLKFYETELNKYSPDWVVLFLDADLSYDSINLHTIKKGVIQERPVPLYEVPFYCSMLQEVSSLIAFACERENRFFPAERDDDTDFNYSARAKALEVALLQKLAQDCAEKGSKLLIVVPDNVSRSLESLAKVADTIAFPTVSTAKSYAKTGYLNREETNDVTKKLFFFFDEIYSLKNVGLPTKTPASMK